MTFFLLWKSNFFGNSTYTRILQLEHPLISAENHVFYYCSTIYFCFIQLIDNKIFNNTLNLINLSAHQFVNFTSQYNYFNYFFILAFNSLITIKIASWYVSNEIFIDFLNLWYSIKNFNFNIVKNFIVIVCTVIGLWKT